MEPGDLLFHAEETAAMTVRRILGALTIAAGLAACDSGDINLSPTTVDNSNVSAPPPTQDNPCASYTEAGQTFQGTLDSDDNCFYDALFVSDTRPITVSAITFPNFGGLHIFEDSLYIGEDVDRNAAATGKRIPQEGEGTRLTIAAGNTLVFQAADSYVRIARGSQIFAEGTAAEPIIFTADEDVILDVATESDRGLWGGLQINGNGQTNKCHDGTPTGSKFAALGSTSEFDATDNNVHNCHVTAEGRPATYGGNNNAENSGALSYVIVKHAGFEVVDGDELNAITLNAVGSGTTISHVQVYTTQDDGFEMFGGAVNMDHIVAVNVGDDSIDYSEGYNGDIQYAVVVHTSGGNRCIEGDNTGGNRADSFTPTTKLRISNLTCVTSNIDENGGMNPSSKGDSEGPLFREGAYFELYNSLITSNETNMNSNECLELDDSEGPETIDAAQAGTSIAIGNIIACSEATKFGEDAANVGFDLGVWLAGGDGSAATPANTNTNNVVEETNLPASLVEGGVGTRGYLTSELLTDSLGGVLFDQTTQLFPASDLGGIFEDPSYLGGANAGDDWLDGWTVGLTDPLMP
jgi:hypothetical protein